MTQNPIATLSFKKYGAVKAELYPLVAPETVKNFISLAERHYYDGLKVHQVVPGYMITGGCPMGNGMGNPGYGIYGEFGENGFDNPLPHRRGALSMLRGAGLNSAGSIFAILADDIPAMDGKQAVFGTVIEGLSVVETISRIRRDGKNRPYFRPTIESITVETFGARYAQPIWF